MNNEPTMTDRYNAGERLTKIADTLVGMQWCQEQELASIAPLASISRRTAKYVDHRAHLALASLGNLRAELARDIEPLVGDCHAGQIAECRQAIATVDSLVVATLSTVWTIAEPTLGGVA